jgi:hypothetical protein
MRLNHNTQRALCLVLKSMFLCFLALLPQTLEVVLTGDGYPEDQVTCAPHLMGVILQNCRGRVDHCVGEQQREKE